MKRTAKTIIVSLILLVCLLVSALALAACNKDDFVASYANAKSAWDSAANKMSTDTGVIDATLGSGENALPVTITLEGKRVYLGDTMRMDYSVKLTGIEDIAGGTFGSVVEDGLDADITVIKDADGVYTLNGLIMGLPLLNATFTESAMKDTIPVLDFAAATFYDPEALSGSGSSYTIPGDTSLTWILDQVAPILAYDAGYDIMPMIYDWIDFGDVTGEVTFADGTFAAMTTSQDIKAFMPYEDAEFLAYNVEFFPRILFNLIEDKVLDINGLITLDFSDVIGEEGIRIEGNVSTSAQYTLLSAETTFEDIFGDNGHMYESDKINAVRLLDRD